jgi:hypothetical protein
MLFFWWALVVVCMFLESGMPAAVNVHLQVPQHTTNYPLHLCASRQQLQATAVCAH